MALDYVLDAVVAKLLLPCNNSFSKQGWPPFCACAKTKRFLRCTEIVLHLS